MTTMDIVAARDDDLVPLVTWVKAREAPYLQAQIAHLVGAPLGGESYRPPHSSTYGPKNAWELAQWQPGEEPVATWILRDLGSNQRRVLARLVAAGAGGVWTGELRREGHYDEAKSMPGVFKAIGGRFRATGRRPAWNGGPKDSQKGQKLAVLDDTARVVFAEAIKAEYSALAEEFGIR